MCDVSSVFERDYFPFVDSIQKRSWPRSVSDYIILFDRGRNADNTLNNGQPQSFSPVAPGLLYEAILKLSSSVIGFVMLTKPFFCLNGQP